MDSRFVATLLTRAAKYLPFIDKAGYTLYLEKYTYNTKAQGDEITSILQISDRLVGLHLGTIRPSNCREWCNGSDSFYRWEQIKTML